MRRSAATLVALATLSLVSVSGCSLIDPDSGGVRWGTPSGTPKFGAAPTTALDVCGLLPVATMAALTGKPFTSSKNSDNPGYACVYEVTGKKAWFWEVSINNVGSKTPDGPDILIGADGGLKSLDGVAYPAIAATDGAALQWGDDEVVVSDESTYSYARGTTSQYLAAAEALMSAINQSRNS